MGADKGDKESKEGITAKCSYCGSEMDCPKAMAIADTHVCSFCGDLLEAGVPESEVKGESLRERKLSKYYPHMDVLSDFIHDTTFGQAKLPKEALKDLSKKEIAEEMYFQGILETLDFLLHEANPNIILALRIAFCPFGEEELGQVIERYKKDGVEVDVENFKKACTKDYDVKTAEGIAALTNDAIFGGDWKKYLEWVEKHGTEKQKGEDIPIIKKLVGNNTT